MKQRHGIGKIVLILLATILQFGIGQGQPPSGPALIKRPIFQTPLTYKLTRSATNDFWGKNLFGSPRGIAKSYIMSPFGDLPTAMTFELDYAWNRFIYSEIQSNWIREYGSHGTADWGVLHLINMIEGAGRDWYDRNRIPPSIGVGDLSKGDANTQTFGGYFRPHVCHQNGIEADFRYVRNDGLEIPLNLSTSDSDFFDKFATIDLFNSLFENADPIKIYVGTFLRGKIEFERIDTVYDAYHNDHFHLRLQDPDGTSN